jgi:hypothetical protein
VRILKRLASVGRKEGEKILTGRGYPPPRVFFVRVANKGVMFDAASGIATAGLKVVLFSGSCRSLVRVARKGLTGASSRAAGHWPARWVAGAHEDLNAEFTEVRGRGGQRLSFEETKRIGGEPNIPNGSRLVTICQ